MQTGAWRLSYTPGPWLVLAGPTSVVILQPASPQWSELVKTVWEDVLASASIHDLAGRMSAFSLDEMPSFGAFFWTDDGMRSLVRGGVVVVDQGSGRTVADGRGVQTWSEVGLGDLAQVRVDLEPQPAEPQLVLPLVVGVVSAGSVLLDSSAAARVALEQGAGGTAAAPVPAVPEPEPTPEPEPESKPEPEPESEPTPEPEPAQADDDDWEDTQFDLPAVPADPTAPMPVTGPAAPAAEASEDGRTVFASSLPGAPSTGPPSPPKAPPAPVRTVLAVLHVSTGGRADVDRPVLIGRSPIASRVKGDQLPRLLTVPSPSHDISRTHLEIAPQDGGLVATDLDSTNGTVLIRVGARPVDLEPGRATPIQPGCVLDLGDGVTIAVDRP